MLPFALMLCLPFFVPVHHFPIPSFYSEAVAFAFGSLGIVSSFVFYRRGDLPIALPTASVAPFGFIAVLLGQMALGMFAYTVTGIIGIAYVLWAGMLMVCAKIIVTNVGWNRFAERCAFALLIAASFNAFCGWMQYLEYWPHFAGLISEPMPVKLSGVYGNLAQQNHFATLMALGLFSAVYLFRAGRLRAMALVPIACLILGPLFLSGSRSSFVYLLVLAFFFRKPQTEDKFKNYEKKRLFLKLVIAASLIAIAVITLYIKADALLQHFPQVKRIATLSETLGTRAYLWSHAWTMFLSSPWLGVGFDAFAQTLIEQLHATGIATRWGIDQYAHNLFLQLLAVTGLAGFFIVFLPLSYFVRRQLRRKIELPHRWAYGVLSVLFVHSMLEQPLYFSYFLGIVAILMGALDDKVWNFSRQKMALSVNAALGLILLCCILKSSFDYVQLDRFFTQAERGSSDTPYTQEQAKALLLDLHSHSIFAPFVEVQAPQLFVPHQAAVKQKLALNVRMMHFAPVADIEFRQAALLAEDGQVDAAKRQFEKAGLAYPHELKIYVERFQFLARNEPESYAELASYAQQFSDKFAQ